MTAVIGTSIHGKRLGLGHVHGELIVDGKLISSANRQLAGIPPAPAGFDPAYAFELFDDFTVADFAGRYTFIDDGGTGTEALADVAGGVLNIPTAAADNDYHAATSPAENWLFAAGKELWFEARFRLTEAATDESTWWFGLSDTLTTGGMQANAAGPLATYDGALIWKTPEAGMTVNFETSNASTQNTLAAFATSVSAVWQIAGFYFDGVGKITPCFHNGTSWTVGTPQAITLTGLEEMHLIAGGVKAGPGGAAETLQVDYVRVVQLR